MYKFILRLFGWKINPEIPKEYDRCVLIGAPHTSNWDFLFSVLSFKALKIPYKFTIKKQWFRFPFNLIIKPIGGLPIDTKGNSQKGISNVDTMASFFSLKEKFVMAITPEGTRSLKKEWKSGFYHVAKKANVGGAASAPVVASAFHPSLAPVGVLLAVLGYALGTYGAIICATLMEMASP